MSNNLLPVAAPDLQPLRNSVEYDQLESELKEVFLAVFENYIRPYERQVNLTGMPHLGDTTLIERTLKADGLAIIRRDDTRSAFLLKAARARNPRRGMIFLKQYLQSVWPGVWKVEPLWHPVATSAAYPEYLTPLTQVTLDGAMPTKAVWESDSGEDLPLIYRTDWQGDSSRMYPTARTNLAPYAGVNATGWSVGPNTTRVSSGTMLGADGVSAASSYKNNGTAGNSFISMSTGRPALKANTWYTASVWMRLVNGVTPANGNLLSIEYMGATSGATVRANVPYANNAIGDGWKRYSVTFFNVVAGTYSLYIHADSSSTAEVSPDGFQIEESIVQTSSAPPTRLIRTTGAAASVTDFTVNASGLATFADGLTNPAGVVYFRTGRIRITLPVSVDNGLGLTEIAKAFRSTLAARLMLELNLSTVFETLGQAGGGFAIAGGAKGLMPYTAIGKLTR